MKPKYSVGLLVGWQATCKGKLTDRAGRINEIVPPGANVRQIVNRYSRKGYLGSPNSPISQEYKYIVITEVPGSQTARISVVCEDRILWKKKLVS